MPSQYSIKTITKIEQVMLLENKWRALIEVNSDNVNSQYNKTSQCFMTWEWLTLWIKTYSSLVDELRFLCIYTHHECIAIAPFYIRKKALGFQKELAFIATNENEEAEVSSEFIDIHCHQKHHNKVIHLVASALFEFKDIDAFKFIDISKKSLIYQVCKCLKEEMLLFGEYNLGCQFILTTKADDLFSTNILSKKKRIINRYQRQEKTEFIIAKDRNEAVSLFNTLIRLHQERWTNKQKKGAFSDQNFHNFHLTLIKQSFSENSALKVIISAISINRNIISVNYSLKNADKLYFYQAGIDESFEPNLSPGILNHLLLLQYCRTCDISEYNLLKSSNKNTYKKNISEQGLEVLSIKMLPFSNLNRFKLIIDSIKPLIQNLLKIMKIK